MQKILKFTLEKCGLRVPISPQPSSFCSGITLEPLSSRAEAPAINNLRNFSFSHWGCQQLRARCQPHGQTYQPVPGIKDSSFLLSTYLRGSYHQDRFLCAFSLRPIMSRAELQRLYADSANLICHRASQGWWRGLSDLQPARWDAWPQPAPSHPPRHCQPLTAVVLGEDTFLESQTDRGEKTAVPYCTSTTLCAPKYPMSGEKLRSQPMASETAGLGVQKERVRNSKPKGPCE